MANPVKLIIEGVQFVMETVNFMSFIAQEASQVSMMGLKEATRKKQWSIGQKIIDTTLHESVDKVWEWTLMYSMTWNPTWPAFYCYWYTAKLYNETLRLEFRTKLKKDMIADGYDPDEIIDGVPLSKWWISNH